MIIIPGTLKQPYQVSRVRGIIGYVSPPQTRPTGFTNEFYQVHEYRGSRVLEHGTKRYGPFRVFNWTQGATIDYDENAGVNRGQILV